MRCAHQRPPLPGRRPNLSTALRSVPRPPPASSRGITPRGVEGATPVPPADGLVERRARATERASGGLRPRSKAAPCDQARGTTGGGRRSRSRTDRRTGVRIGASPRECARPIDPGRLQTGDCAKDGRPHYGGLKSAGGSPATCVATLLSRELGRPSIARATAARPGLPLARLCAGELARVAPCARCPVSTASPPTGAGSVLRSTPWENVRDWQHLPWLHRESFASITRARSRVPAPSDPA